MNNFGEKVRSLREAKGILLRQTAAFLEVDTAFVSKVERGQKRASRTHAIKLATYLNVPQNDLLALWLADKISETIGEDPWAQDALKIVLKQTTGRE